MTSLCQGQLLRPPAAPFELKEKSLLLLHFDSNGKSGEALAWPAAAAKEAHASALPEGGYFVAGSFEGDFASEPEQGGVKIEFRSVGRKDAFLARVGKTGLTLWANRFGGEFDDVIEAVVAESDKDFAVRALAPLDAPPPKNAPPGFEIMAVSGLTDQTYD